MQGLAELFSFALSNPQMLEQLTPPSGVQGVEGPLGAHYGADMDPLEMGMAAATNNPAGLAVASSPRLNEYDKLQKIMAILQEMGLGNQEITPTQPEAPLLGPGSLIEPEHDATMQQLLEFLRTQ